MQDSKVVSSIGARTLSKQEIRKVLPTYDTMFQQIEDIRNQVGNLDEKNLDGGIIQKTNSFGILGKRGTGKTSILYTIRQRLKDENPQDITLPLLVPDNMANDSDIMGAILGSFLKVVKELEHISNKFETIYDSVEPYSDCKYRSRQQNVLRNAYNEVCKVYCYVQPEYRQILISNYTDLPSYITKSSEVINGDSQFTEELDRFLCILVKEKKRLYKLEHKDKADKTPLIHIFIDDIDLSPERSSEIAKIILAYLSHRSIIIHISGDLDTFEEALTMSFLQDKGGHLESGYLKQEILQDKELLARKRELSYEYLKKIIPPAYRQNLNYWDIYSRGNYRICKKDNDKDDEIENKSLSELIVDVFHEYDIEGLFLIPEDISKIGEKDLKYSDLKKTLVPLTYHLFDETSRGLNNVYSLLLNEFLKQEEERNDKNKKENQEKEVVDFTFKKKFIEVIISSNPHLNKYRDVLSTILCWGENEEDTWIRCDNLFNLLSNKLCVKTISENVPYYKIKSVGSKKSGNCTKDTQTVSTHEIIECFSLYVLIYLVSRIFIKSKIEWEKLMELNNLISYILVLNPIIMESTESIEYSSYKCDINRIIKEKSNEKKDLNEHTENLWFINKFILNQDTEFAFIYYCILTSELNKYSICNEEATNTSYLIALYKTLRILGGIQSDKQVAYKKSFDLKEWYRANIEGLNVIYSLTNYSIDNKVFSDLFENTEVMNNFDSKKNVDKICKEYLFVNKSIENELNEEGLDYYEKTDCLIDNDFKFESEEVELVDQIIIYKSYLSVKCPRSSSNDYIRLNTEYVLKLIKTAAINGLRETIDFSTDNIKNRIGERIKEAKAAIATNVVKEDKLLMAIMDSCHEKNTWDFVWINSIVEKIIKKINLSVTEIWKKSTTINMNIKSEDKSKLKKFVLQYKNCSYKSTIALKTATAIDNILTRITNKEYNNSLENPIVFIEVYVLLYNLSINNRVSYGQFEAKEVLKAMDNVGFKYSDESDLYENMKIYSLYYIDYLIHTDKDKIQASRVTAELLQSLNVEIEEKQKEYQDNIIKEIKELLNDESYSDEYINALLSE